jgi:manganese-dependent inorganic pyrophosphatase
MTIKVFGHTAPDTDSAGSAIVWAWYLREVRGEDAEAALLGDPSTEAAFVMERWNLAVPGRLTEVPDGQRVVIVDTNNPAELCANIQNATILQIIDHHKLTGGLSTTSPPDVTIRPVASTATIVHELMGEDAGRLPEGMKGAILSCILSDTLEFRSPTTTPADRALAEALAADLGIEIPAYAAEMFAAKSDVSGYTEAELLRMDSKELDAGGIKYRVSVIETTSPAQVLGRKAALMAAMPKVALEDGVNEVLLFVVDILNEEATLLVPNDLTRGIAEQRFGAAVEGDSVVLPGIMSRKKQIIPALAA